MKLHKGKLIVGIILLILGILGVIGGIGSNSPETNMGGTIAAAAICAAVGVLLIWMASKPSKAQKARAQSRIDEAEQYFSERTLEADNYYNRKVQEAEAFYAEKAKAIDDYKKQLSKEIRELESRRDAAIQASLVDDVNLADYQDMKSDEIKNELAMLRTKQSQIVQNGDAVKVLASSAPKRKIAAQSKQLLRCFNAECISIVDKVTLRNVDASRDRIARSFETLNRIFADDGMQISEYFLKTKFEELSLAYSYQVKQEEEKEQRRAIREQMVEEEKVRKEIEREKLKIEKEEAQFSNEINKLMAYMQSAKDEVERKLYLDKIQDLQGKLDDLQKDKDNVLQREQNTRAGFVYIISNIGSFGEQVYKIGMTRRLEPMDRIAELSSASVPFPFDVHALIFSDDAPHLENVLHQHFDKQRVNQVNPRKEFFHVNLEEIKKVVLENHNATVKFVDIPDALEYRETLKLEKNE